MISRLAPGITLALALTACTESADFRSTEQIILNEASKAQRETLVDGVVTSNEYYDAFLRFSACVSAAGFEIESQVSSDQTIDFHVSSAPGSDEAQARCYLLEFAMIDAEWQVAHEETSPETHAP